MNNTDGMKRVQSLIKVCLNQLESLPNWQNLPPDLTNALRRILIRSIWGAYKIGLLTEKTDNND